MTDARDGSGGPVPAREMLRPADPRAGAEERGGEKEAPGTEAAAATGAVEFELEGEAWVARAAGGGAYGTGRLGRARLTAVHFYRAADPDTPVREALIPAGTFGDLFPAELGRLFGQATPIDLDR